MSQNFNFPCHGPVLYPGSLRVGPHSYASGPVQLRVFTPEEFVTVGDYCAFGQGITLMSGGNHRTDRASTFDFKARFDLLERKSIVINGVQHQVGALDPVYQARRNTSIGHDVWIGDGATVGGGAQVGHGVVLGAHSVVMGADLAPYSVWIGNPAKFHRWRFTKDLIEQLLFTAWWEWPEEKVKTHADDFYLPVEEFLQKHCPRENG